MHDYLNPSQNSISAPLHDFWLQRAARSQRICNVALAKSMGVELDERGYIKTDSMMQTNIDGVFAAGDVANHFGSFKQDITAAAMGAVAATSAYNDRKVHRELCPIHAQ